MLLMGKSTISMAIFNSKLLVYQRVPYLTIKHEMKKHHELGLCHEHPGDTKVPVFVVNRCARRTENWWKPAKSIMRLASSWLPDASNHGKHPGGVSMVGFLPAMHQTRSWTASFRQVLKFTTNSPGEARWWVDKKRLGLDTGDHQQMGIELVRYLAW